MKCIFNFKGKMKDLVNELQKQLNTYSLNIGDKVIIINRMGYNGKVVTPPVRILGVINYGIEFDNEELNKVFSPYYVPENLLEKI